MSSRNKNAARHETHALHAARTGALTGTHRDQHALNLAPLRANALVAYGGRAGLVKRVRTISADGIPLDVLEIAFTGGAKAVVLVPLRRVASSVVRISKHEADRLDEDIQPVLTLAQKKMRRARAAKLAKVADWCRMGGIAKAARKRAA